MRESRNSRKSRRLRHHGHDHLLGRDRRAALDVLDDAQFVLPGSERRFLHQQHPLAAPARGEIGKSA